LKFDGCGSEKRLKEAFWRGRSHKRRVRERGERLWIIFKIIFPTRIRGGGKGGTGRRGKEAESSRKKTINDRNVGRVRNREEVIKPTMAGQKEKVNHG